MYNRYLPDGEFAPVEPERQESRRQERGTDGPNLSLPLVDDLLKRFHLDRFDSGDILLILVLVYLSRESGDQDWLIVLALAMLLL